MPVNSVDSLEERDWTFTFGIGHPLFAGMFVDIYGTYNSARAKMTEVFGTNWSFQYESHEKAGVERHDLREIQTILNG